MDGQTDGRTTDGRTDRHTDVERETIIPCHYRVAGYKKVLKYDLLRGDLILFIKYFMLRFQDCLNKPYFLSFN